MSRRKPKQFQAALIQLFIVVNGVYRILYILEDQCEDRKQKEKRL